MYEIDTEATATVTESSDDEKEAPAAEAAPAEDTKAASKEAPAAEPKTSAPSSSSSDGDEGRKSSIHFLGKEGWARRLSGKPDEPLSLIPDTPNGVVVLDGSMLTSSYGRPAFSEAEMEALMSGGASVAPKVIASSTGAKFSF